MADAWRSEFARTPVQVTAPNEQVFVTLVGDSWVEVRFAPGHYERATDQAMAEQLTRVVRLLYVERTRRFYDGLSQEAGQVVRPGTDRTFGRSRDYRQRLAQVAAEGESADGSVRMFGVGLSEFSVHVVPGTLARLSELEFAAACREAGLAFLADHLQQVRELKFDIYIRPDLESAGLVPR